ncbi:hypothetical protein GAY28_11655 [Azospirillum brasilense]|nr:hypothetical protein [Azospirillum brasilense]
MTCFLSLKQPALASGPGLLAPPLADVPVGMFHEPMHDVDVAVVRAFDRGRIPFEGEWTLDGAVVRPHGQTNHQNQFKHGSRFLYESSMSRRLRRFRQGGRRPERMHQQPASRIGPRCFAANIAALHKIRAQNCK